MSRDKCPTRPELPATTNRYNPPTHHSPHNTENPYCFSERWQNPHAANERTSGHETDNRDNPPGSGGAGLYDFRRSHILSFLYGTERAGDRMRFHLIDRIDRWESGKSLFASKYLALGEEYLADHFPQFPVMPGVLMLQACVESAAWL